MAGALMLLFKKYRKMPKGTKTFMRLLFSGAVATFFYGLITGGFLGDFIDAFPLLAFLRPLKNALALIDPMQDPMTVLGLSLFLGVVQLMFGLGIRCRGFFLSWALFSSAEERRARCRH